MFNVDGSALNLHYHKLWETYIEEDSYYSPIESIDEIEWEEGGHDCFLDVDIWNVMCDALFGLLS